MAIPAKDVGEYAIERIYTPAERAKLRYEEEYKNLLKDSEDLLISTVTHSGNPISDSTLRKVTANQVYRRADESGVTLSDEEFYERAESFYQRLSAGVESKTRSMYEASKDAISKGALTYPTDVILSVEQNKRIEAALPWNWEASQLKNSYLRKERIPDEFMTEFITTSPEQIINNEKIPQFIRDKFLGDLQVDQIGAPSREDTRYEATGWAVPFDFLLKALGAPSEVMAAMTASRLRQLRGMSGYLEEIYQTTIPSMEQLREIDHYNRPIELSELPFGSVGSSTDVEEAKGPYGVFGTETGQMRAALMMDIPHMGMSVRRRPKAIRKLGISREKQGAILTKEGSYESRVSWTEQLKNMGRGFVYDIDAGSIAKEFGYLRSAYSAAATKALDDLDPADERWSRYYGMSAKDRMAEAAQMAEKRLRAGGHEPTNQEIKGMALMLYKDLPQQKMIKDMLALDTYSYSLNNPQGAEMLHKILIDPLWLTGPGKLLGGAGRAAKWGLLGAGKLASKLPVKAAEPILTGMIKTTDMVDAVARPIVMAKSAAMKPLNDLFSHYTKHWDEFDDFDAMAAKAQAAGRSVEEVVDSTLARSAMRGTEAQAVGDIKKLKDAAKEIDDAFSEMPLPEGKVSQWFFGKSQAAQHRDQLGKVLRGDITLDSATAGSQKIVAHLVGEAEHLKHTKKWIKEGKKGTPPPAPASRLDPVEMMELMAHEATMTGQLATKYGHLPGKIRAAANKFEKIARETGQFDKIRKGVVDQARYVDFFVPRYLQFTEKIHEAVIKAGYKGIGEAAEALTPARLPEALKKLRTVGYKGTDDEIIRQVVGGIILEGQTKKQGVLGLLDPWIKDVVNEASKARIVLPQHYWDDIRNLQKVSLDADFLGSTAVHRINATTRSAKARTPLGELYPWIKDAQFQYQSYTKAIVAKAGKTAEIKHLGEAFGVDKVAGTLGGPSMIKISKGGLGKSKGKGTEKMSSQARMNQVADDLTNHMGMEMVPLVKNGDHGLSRKVAAALLPKGARVGKDAVVFLPKAIAKRFDELLPLVGPKNDHAIVEGIKLFRDYVIRPMNAIYRPTRTLLRSPAFYALNYFGAVGLGALAHGARALNPALQKGAHHAAWMAAFGGSKKALNTEFVLKSGVTMTIGDAIKLGEKYGILQQGTLKYALDVSSGKGPLAWYGKQLQELTQVTRAQQVANFGDNYQKFVAMLGHLKDPNNVRDVYRTLDFVTEYAGNYNMLTKFEKGTMRDLFMFYSWNRFILPHLVNQMWKNPNRLQAFERMRSVMEYNTKHQAPGTGLGVPDWIHMQRGITAPMGMQPGPGEAAPHEFAMGVIETPLASASVLAGGFRGESPIQAQLGPLGWVLINALTGFDHATGHAWEKPYVMPGPENFNNVEGFKDWLYNFNDTKVGREVTETIPFGGAMLNILKLYGDNGMHNEQAELWMRLRAGRDFFGLDNLIAKMAGGTPLSLPGQFNIFGVNIPAPFIRGYAVRPLSVARRQQRKILKSSFKGEQ